MNNWLHKSLKLSHKKHTGKRLHRKHTSHSALLLLLLAAGMLLVWVAKTEQGNQATLANDITITGTIPGPAPQEPPVIEKPEPGATFTNNPVEITGHRPNGNVVEIYSNGIFGGAAGCTDGDFNGKISLVVGNNEIKARQVDSLNQYGPFSEPFKVGFLPRLQIESGVSQFFIVPSAAYHGRLVGEPYRLQASIIGGKAPYAVKINWGDGAESLISRAEAGNFSESHEYSQPKCYVVSISATDSAKHTYTAQTVVIISGTKQQLEALKGSNSSTNTYLNMLWPLFLVSFGAITLFWLGERFQIEEDESEVKPKLNKTK